MFEAGFVTLVSPVGLTAKKLAFTKAGATLVPRFAAVSHPFAVNLKKKTFRVLAMWTAVAGPRQCGKTIIWCMVQYCQTSGMSKEHFFFSFSTLKIILLKLSSFSGTHVVPVLPS